MNGVYNRVAVFENIPTIDRSGSSTSHEGITPDSIQKEPLAQSLTEPLTESLSSSKTDGNGEPVEIHSLSRNSQHPQAPLKDTDAPIAPIAAIIPAYNECLVIGSVVLQSRQYVETVIVVDDGSADKTAEIARLAGADVVVMPENGGKAHAMMAGFARAKDLGYDTVVMLDGDGQHNPDEIPAVVAPVLAGKADLVIGSRFLKCDTNGEIPKYRIAGQKVLNGFTTAASGHSCSDSQSGFRALGPQALRQIFSSGFTSEGYDIESDMIANLAQADLTIGEVPINVTYNVPHKHKKNPISHGFGVLAKLVGVIGYRRPLLSFGVPGAIFFIIGFILELFTFSQYVRTGAFHYILFTGGIAFLTLGLLALMCGLILNSLVIIMKEHRTHGGQ